MQAVAIKKDTVRLLRFPFSLFLAPVFLFALSQAQAVAWAPALFAFMILHLLVYPSSNGYNSYMDRDTGSIGGLRNPPPPSKELFHVTLIMDLLAVVLMALVHAQAAAVTALYILASRAYSGRRVRLKKYPWTGFFTVVIFQGAGAFLIGYLAVSQQSLHEALDVSVMACALAATLFIGASYPLTQIYQHDADSKNGDITLSCKLGFTGTFFFSGALFIVSSVLLCWYFYTIGRPWQIIAYIVFTAPSAFYFIKWFLKVKTDRREANFENTMRMNSISAGCLAAFFLFIALTNFLIL